LTPEKPPRQRLELSEATQERRMLRRMDHVLTMLEDAPEARFAILSSNQMRHGELVMTIALRGVALFEMSAPLEKCDGWKLLELINRTGGKVGDE
jgi:hypothetical protein